MRSSHLQRCQVETPPDVVKLVWLLAKRARPGEKFKSVLDLGAGDGRFGKVKGAFERYVGIEMDSATVVDSNMPAGSRLIVGDALKWKGSGYSIAIGNPPYIRHHGLEPEWRDDALARIANDGGPSLKATANAFVIFLAKALQQTSSSGLVVQLIPYEWVTRPSSAELREYITKQGWDVHVYRFDVDIFPTVLTTASVTIIDKASRQGLWTFGQIGRDGQIKKVRQPSGSTSKVLAYKNGSDSLHAIRGLSPGGQSIFVLTEQERLFYGLRRKTDVVPCVTSLRLLEDDVTDLTAAVFEDRYVARGQRCWLIRSDRDILSPTLSHYLKSVGTTWKQYSTCTARGARWWQYKPHPVPQILIASGFTKKAPKVLINSVKAIAVGSVYGIVSDDSLATPRQMVRKLRTYDFERRVVHHSNNLKKIEVRQLNAVLHQLFD
jgi:hypothetical protein